MGVETSFYGKSKKEQGGKKPQVANYTSKGLKTIIKPSDGNSRINSNDLLIGFSSSNTSSIGKRYLFQILR